MFKYISEILGQFTAPQRIIALLLLLFSIVVVTLGPSYIDSITLNKDEYNVEIEKQKELNKEFSDEIQRLNRQIIDNQRACTDEIITREMEIMNQIEQLKRDIESTSVTVSQSSQMVIGPSDSSTVIRRVEPIKIIADPRPKMMMDGLNRIQGNIREDVDKMKGNN